MINSFLASSHSSAGAGAGAASAATAITLHFNYSSNNNNNNNSSSSSSSNKSNININKSSSNNNNNSGLKIVPALMAVAATNEHKSRNIIHSAPPAAAAAITTTTTTTAAANIFKIRQSQSKPGVVAKRLIMPFDQQKLQQQQRGIISNWEPVNGKFNTSASTKEPQFIQVVKFKSSSSSSNNNNNNCNKQSLQSTTAAIHKSAFTEVLSKPQQQQQQQQQQQKQRTEDQENAFRQIEDVHNYAKLQRHQHQPGGSSSSDEIEDEEEDDEDDDVDEEELVEEEHEQQGVHKELRVDVEFIPAKKKTIIHNDEDSEEHVEVDVVTVTPTTPQQQQQQQQQQLHEEEQPLSSPNPEPEMRPEHHARRPMNAFLIFCKRHRAIVKERYKSLENRAITKILGDWWAALDDKEKLCFTDLAQQNKDAFFNANPNFKWYKLPAPPLRTLATRPGNAAATAAQSTDELQQQQQQQPHLQWEPKEVAHMLRRNYFKFADETQMGELSALLSGNATQENKDYALQQALSETTQFLSVHMPNSSTANNNNINNKRALQLTDSASNSSEEEERGSPSKKLKSSRSCKGKIYQELINSGQLAAIAKKSKCRLNSGGSANQDTNSSSSSPPISPRAAMAAATAADCQMLQLEATTTSSAAAGAAATTGSAVRHSFEFDLEEKIKELPALSLDAYLQRKRSTKKKKKFSSNKKQRNSNSSSSISATTTTSAGGAAAASSPTMTPTAAGAAAATSPGAVSVTPATAVGSQKRKARKESITRRDVSAIEQEVASILPLTINGCYCINHSQLPPPRTQPAAAAATAPASAAATVAATSSGFDVASPTSDLLILAEVAANRTELTKSN